MVKVDLNSIPENIRERFRVNILAENPEATEYHMTDEHYHADDYPEFFPVIQWLLWNGAKFGEEVIITL